MGEWVKMLVIGFLQPYLYGQLEDLKRQVAKKNPAWFPADGGIAVEPGDELAFFKAVFKGLLYVIQHGK
jgi:hypothetical protein